MLGDYLTGDETCALAFPGEDTVIFEVVGEAWAG